MLLAIPSSNGAALSVLSVRRPALAPGFEEDRCGRVLGGLQVGGSPEAVGLDCEGMALIEVAERLGVAGFGPLPQLQVVCHHSLIAAGGDSVPRDACASEQRIDLAQARSLRAAEGRLGSSLR
jgi:hypothetical protein